MILPDRTADFSRFLGAHPGRLHVAAHSHHPWPDVSAQAQQQAWDTAARLVDRKWDEVLDAVVPEAQRHIAGRLGLPDPATLAVGPNSHGLVNRVLSCLPRPARVLTTDSEFHSFARQVARLVEEGQVDLAVVDVEPFDTFTDRFTERAAASSPEGPWHLVHLSQVFYNSGYVVDDLAAIVGAVVTDDTFVVIDGYHGFMALPTDLRRLADRVFYVAGGYKYAMAGEGACFLHCPAGYAERPVDTGWYAAFGALEEDLGGRIPYAPGGGRFLGSTFDPTPWYRFNAVQRWFDDVDLTVEAVHAHVGALQRRFLALLDDADIRVSPADLVPPRGQADRGHFLTFRLPDAGALHAALLDRDVITDVRGDRLRFGFGLYHRPDDLEVLLDHLRAVA